MVKDKEEEKVKINMIIKEVVDGQVTDYIEKNKVETKTACKKKGFFSKLFN